MENEKLLHLGHKAQKLAHKVLKAFNDKNIRIVNLAPHQRIFIFFLTRSVKTYSSIYLLCQNGYGQDIATLLRSMLENLISVHYILADPETADEKASRFVDYKWIVFRRYISNIREQDPGKTNDLLMKKLIVKKEVIAEKVQLFREKYHVKSDKALVTWSGRTLRDMAKMSNSHLIDEYDSTYRLSSRFSHPSIIGDRAYIKYKENNMIFSPSPSSVGVETNLRIAIQYLLDFLKIFNEHFGLNHEKDISILKDEFSNLPEEEPQNIHSKTAADLDKDKIRIKFEI